MHSGHGCPGVIAKPISREEAEKAGVHKALVRRKVIYLPFAYSEKNGVWRKQTRARFRDPTMISHGKHLRERRPIVEKRLSEAQGDQERKWEEEELKNIAQFGEVLKKWKKGLPYGEAFTTFEESPLIVECPSCHTLNRVPSFRGPIDVRDGKLLK